MCIQENLFVFLHSNGPAHGSFQPCDHNLQFHSWLWEMAQVVWIAWVRHIPSSVSLFIVLIFCERFISFRKSSRKASNAYFLLAGVSGGCGTAGVGGYGNPANWADRKKSYPYTNCMDFLVIRITACFCWPQLFICTCTSNTWENAHFYICEKNLNRTC